MHARHGTLVFAGNVHPWRLCWRGRSGPISIVIVFARATCSRHCCNRDDAIEQHLICTAQNQGGRMTSVLRQRGTDSNRARVGHRHFAKWSCSYRCMGRTVLRVEIAEVNPLNATAVIGEVKHRLRFGCHVWRALARSPSPLTSAR